MMERYHGTREIGAVGAGRPFFWLLALLLAGICLAGCGCGAGRTDSESPEAESGASEKLKVAATIFPYYDFARQIAGDRIDLELVVPAGMDSHSFEPTPAHMRTIEEADVLICNGGAMEQWVRQVLAAVDRPDLEVVTMMDYVDVVQEEIVEGMEDEAHGHDLDHGAEGADSAWTETETVSGAGGGQSVEEETYAEAGGTFPADNRSFLDTDGDQPEEETADFDHDGHEYEIEYDEHIWTSPVNAMKLAGVIAEALAEADPAHAEEYAVGAEAYQAELAQIHRGFQEVVENRKRNMIVVGDKFPFRYLAEEYGLTYRAAFSGCSTDTEPSARTIAYLIDKVREGEIPVVYYLELSSHRVAEIIGEETGAVPLLLHSCHNVTRRELEDGVTYAELMRQNIENLRKGLDE